MSGDPFAAQVVSASAGSGKTHALTSRYLGLLTQGVSPDAILATTFTRKAAGEILDRVLSRLAEACNSEAAAEKLSGQIGQQNLTAAICAKHLRRLVTQFLEYYHSARCHQALDGNAPDPRKIEAPTEGKVIAVPRAAIKVGQPNRIRFAMEGRGRYGFAAVLSGFTREFGPDQDRANRVAWVERRAYYPAAPELDGKTLATGFSVAVNPTTFENLASQVGLGGRARVAVTVYRNVPWNTPGYR